MGSLIRMKRGLAALLLCWMSSGDEHTRTGTFFHGVHGWHQSSSFRSGRRRGLPLVEAGPKGFLAGSTRPKVRGQRPWSTTAFDSRLQVATPATAPTDLEEMILRELYPPTGAIANGSLPVDETHTLSYQVHGSGPLKALFLHGGPGAGCFPNHARFFDLQHYQVILLDQRGCGQSTPRGCLVNQTLDHLVDDCEALRQHLQFSTWHVVLGGSWGTTVATAYAQKFPASIKSVILRGVCMLRSQEVDWLFASDGGAALQHTQAWESFAKAVNVDTIEYPRQVLHESYRRLVLGSNDTERWNAARAWMKWEFFNSVAYQIPEGTNVSDPNATMQALQSWNTERRPTTSIVAIFQKGSESYQTANGNEIMPNQLPVDLASDEASLQTRFRRGISSPPSTPTSPEPWPFPDIPEGNSSFFPIQAMLTCFYSTNDDYCRNGRNLLDGGFSRIPCIAIHGGADAICPPDTALDLLEAWPGMELRMPVHAGHSMYDPYITHEIIQATDRMARMLLPKQEG